MLVKLTNRCFEGCSHCMEDSRPDGNHMSRETLEDLVEFTELANVRILIISGGEFTTDPEFRDKIEFLIRNCTKVISMSLITNGSWIENPSIVKDIQSLLNQNKIVTLQVSTNKHFYPNYEWTMEHEEAFKSLGRKVLFVHDWQGSLTSLTRLGRASNLPNSMVKGAPQCSPFLSRCQNIDRINYPKCEFSVRGMINFMEMSGYPCKPLVNENGTVHIGETQFCVKVGDINGLRLMSKDEKAFFMNTVRDNILNAKMCDRCKQVRNLTGRVPEYILANRSFR